MLEGDRVMVKGDTDRFGYVYEITYIYADDELDETWSGQHKGYFVEFDDGMCGVYDRSELIEVPE